MDPTFRVVGRETTRIHRDQRGQSLVIVLSLITLLFLLGSALAVHTSVALRATRASEGQGDDFYAADAATELGIWWQRNGKAGNPPAQTINGVTTSTTISSAGGGSCPAAPAGATWLTGFEHGAVSAAGLGLFDAVTTVGVVAVTATAGAARTGAFGLSVPTSNASNYAFVSRTTAGATRVARVSIQIPALPAGSGDAPMVVFNANVGSALSLLYRTTTQKLALRIGSGTPVDATATLTAGTWYGIDIRYTVGTNPRRGEWQIDGVAQTDVTSAEATATSITSVQLGAAFAGVVMTTYYDDVMLSATGADYPIGQLNVSSLALNGMGTSNNSPSFQNNDNTAINATSYTRLDETPMTSLADYIKQVTSNSTRYIEMTFADTTQGCIRGVSAVLAYHGSGTAANTGKTSIFDGATERIVYSGAMNVTALSYKSLLVPPIAAPWSQAALDGLLVRVGYSSDINPLPFWDAVLLEYGWRTSIPATITVVGSAGGSTVSTSYQDAGAGVPSLTTWTATQ